MSGEREGKEVVSQLSSYRTLGTNSNRKMASLQHQDKNLAPVLAPKDLYRKHWQGALVRSFASLIMWLFALTAFLGGNIKSGHLIGVSASVAFLTLFNLPTLWVLKKILRKDA